MDKESKGVVSIYCPFCKRNIEAINQGEVESGEHEGYVFVHDEGVQHDKDFDFKPTH